MLPELSRSMLKNSSVLAVFAAITVAVVAFTQLSTAERIEQSIQQARELALAEVLPPSLYDNALLDSMTLVDDPLLSNTQPSPLYVATLNGKPSALVFNATAPDGYSGSIRLLIAVLANGQISGVRVIQHKETPGLGDKIELAKSPWILSFNGKSLTQPAIEHWGVKKDQGEFDQFAGATITPRAVVKATQQALVFFDQRQQDIFNTYLAQQGMPEEE
ncbi:electron transport complex subunit RsxG [Thiopseudomonas alkaliphila]|uniref:electron transport complex subunit RsxG n=1 Tax=Thiopseudomonas alkaliphila TaxID=1697053 RepID=UPI000B2D982D|nr:electron transport complex subunit RsxG [Thiopseudomonas alkaliphila]